MKRVICEYASMITALVATMGFLAIVEQLFLGEQGFFSMLILTALGGV